MKKIENITIRTLRGVAFKKDKDEGLDWHLVDLAITALEQAQGLGFKVYRLGLKLTAMQEVGAPDIILEDAELEGLKKAINALRGGDRAQGVRYPDFVIDQAIEAMDEAKDHKLEVK